MPEGCGCNTSWPGGNTQGIDAFARVRSACPALRDLLVPDGLWAQFEQWHRQPQDSSHHRSILVLAAQRGYLAQVISPVHRYLLRDGAIRPGVKRQYVQDLQERWMLEPDALRRHQKARIFCGKLAELQVAEWLDTQGWTVENLEALGAASDIEATRPDDHTTTSFEVKLIGVEDSDFEMILSAFAGGPAGQSVSAYDAANYLLYRAYEAAHQLLRGASNKRIVVLVVEGLSWHRFDLQLRDGWIDWEDPSFYDGNSWPRFVVAQGSRFPLPGDLAATFRSVDAVWIFKREDGHALSRESVVQLRRA